MTRLLAAPHEGRLRVPVVSTRDELRVARRGLTGRVAVVMTMGALHEGHLSLVRAARAYADRVIVTIFVNPLQFGANDDLDRYPRPFADDLARCADAGVDLVFAPGPSDVYPRTPTVRVDAGDLGERFEGASRPGHLSGMLTVVLKLLHLTSPDVALFGEKDAQQLACIRAMVADLDVPVRVVGVPTVREGDGLAMSSRNRYLSDGERAIAQAIPRALATRDAARARDVLERVEGLSLDYLEQVDSETFLARPDGDLLVLAAKVGRTRLIDNARLPTRLDLTVDHQGRPGRT